jgi:multicomponent Na+:H+ antiporter subunit G
MSNIVGEVLLCIGLAFNIIGCIGMVRFPDFHNRLHAATKCVTLGTCLFLVGTMVMTLSWALVFKCLICMVFILTTSPTAAHALSRGAHAAGVKLWEKSVADAYEDDIKLGLLTGKKE